MLEYWLILVGERMGEEESAPPSSLNPKWILAAGTNPASLNVTRPLLSTVLGGVVSR